MRIKATIRYAEECKSKEQESIRQVEGKDYLTCLPLWLRYRPQLFQEVSNMEEISHPLYLYLLECYKKKRFPFLSSGPMPYRLYHAILSAKATVAGNLFRVKEEKFRSVSLSTSSIASFKG